jgi:hypothetical protein
MGASGHVAFDSMNAPFGRDILNPQPRLIITARTFSKPICKTTINEFPCPADVSLCHPSALPNLEAFCSQRRAFYEATIIIKQLY